MRNVLLFLYIIVTVFLYVLNFELFNSQVNMDFGFGVYNTMPILFIVMIGLLFLILFVLIGNYTEKRSKSAVSKLESRIALLEKDLEIKDLKQQIEHNVEHNVEISDTTETIETENN